MVKGLYIGATRKTSGKAMFLAGIGLHMQKEGINFGYMKPVGDSPEKKGETEGDGDAIFLQEIFGFNEPQSLVSPILLTQDFKAEVLSGRGRDLLPIIQQAYESMAKDKDAMLLGGSGDWMTGKYCGLDAVTIAKKLDLKTIFVDRITELGASNDILLTIKEQLGDQMLGVILNDIPPSFYSEVDNVIKPFLEKKGVTVLGAVQSDPIMRSIRADELAENLGGRLVTAQHYATRQVEHFLIGTMQVENFTSYFRREPNSAVLVGGDRADVQLVAIEGQCPCIVLTGNLFPNDIILSRAETMKVPIIMVRSDTYTVAKKMEALLRSNKMRDTSKVKHATQLVDNSLDFSLIKNALAR